MDMNLSPRPLCVVIEAVDEDYPKTLMEFEARNLHRAGLPCVLGATALAARIRMPSLLSLLGPNRHAASLDLRGLPPSDFAMAGTVFQDSRKPLTLWLRAVW